MITRKWAFIDGTTNNIVVEIRKGVQKGQNAF